MYRPQSPLSVTALALALSLSPLAPALAQDQPSPLEINSSSSIQGQDINQASKTVLHTEHTDALALALGQDGLDMFTYADLPQAPRSRLDPARTVFNLEDREETRLPIPEGFDFLGKPGETIWLAPQTQVKGVLWPGWNTEDIRPGQLSGDKLNLELIQARTPENGAVEVFQSSLTGTTRIFSSQQRLAAHQQAVGSHVHANWAFTTPGTYQLTFRASGSYPDGSPVSAEQTYTFVVGELSANPEGEDAKDHSTPRKPDPSQPATPEPTKQVAEPAAVEPPVAAAAPPQPEAGEQASTTAGQKEASRLPAASPQSMEKDLADPPAPHPAPQTQERVDEEATVSQQANPAAQPSPAQTSHSQPSAQEQGTRADRQQATIAPQCYATEEQVHTAVASKGRPTSAQARASSTSAQKPALSVMRAVNTKADRVSSGHFDFGPVLKSGSLSARVKDDRTSPARWKEPAALTFILGQDAKTSLPAGMEHIAPAGSEIYLIGATQEPHVPWLGWNTQDPELVAQAAGPVELRLSELQGPGQLSVFLSGNFGAAGTTVFNKVGDTYSVPLNTHQHGNWIFTEEGVYTATLTWSVPLKNGQRATASGTLRFEVGDTSQSADQKPEQQADQKTEQNKSSEAIKNEADIVTRPDGTKVRIVGKTAQGENCDLSAEQLASAQRKSARGELAYTGSTAKSLLAGGLTTVTLGTLLLLIKRRSARRVSTHE
ncbi:TIGR03773 family transporter-associated surface protein [Rothia sp. CCM 9416]|uniref:TIGR03773 family transporter-associated surface protein n=1 Tax=Rothia sp. CCM 9416 TaxID=3402655 RepID=UPI003AEE00C2